VQELIPLRYGRMLVSPFTFFRGAAAIMAADLAGTPESGVTVQLCGDAHLSNFGLFGSPERRMLFDINDFDETLPGPWEWDVKRLAASVEIAARESGFKPGQRRRAVVATVRGYREAMRAFAAMRNLEVWYARVDAAAILADAVQQVDARDRARIDRLNAKAMTKDSTKALSKLTQSVDGESRFLSDPPLIVPVSELLPGASGEAIREQIGDLLRQYQETLRPDRRHLLEGFRYVDLARKVVGVGSVGTRAWIMLLLGRDEDDPLFLQLKEAESSVLEPFLGKSEYSNHGRRVVEGQRLTQAASDIMLGWVRTPSAFTEGVTNDLYVRQLWDAKGSALIELMEPQTLAVYAQICGWSLARAHARSGDPVALASYVGKSDVLDRALAAFAETYADQNERDYRELAEAAKTGAVAVETGV